MTSWLKQSARPHDSRNDKGLARHDSTLRKSTSVLHFATPHFEKRRVSRISRLHASKKPRSISHFATLRFQKPTKRLAFRDSTLPKATSVSHFATPRFQKPRASRISRPHHAKSYERHSVRDSTALTVLTGDEDTRVQKLRQIRRWRISEDAFL